MEGLSDWEPDIERGNEGERRVKTVINQEMWRKEESTERMNEFLDNMKKN